MPGGPKSRSGCAICKEKRLKCDLTSPACRRCLRSNLTCPGYERPLRWSTKHESLKGRTSHIARRVHETVMSLPEGFGPANVDIDQDLVNASSSAHASNIAPSEPNNPFVRNGPVTDPDVWLDFESLPDMLTTDFTQENTPGLIAEDDRRHNFWISERSCELLDVGNTSRPSRFEAQEDVSDEPFIDSITHRTRRSPALTAQAEHNLYSLKPTLTRSEDALIEYYFKEVAIIYSCYDGVMNPFRSIVASVWTSSVLLTKTLQSMAAACLAPEYPHLNAAGLTYRREVLASLEDSASINEPLDVLLLVTIMLGQTAGWHDPSDLGLVCYRDAKVLLMLLESTNAGPNGTSLGTSMSFFRTAIEYWEMLFAFISDGHKATQSPLPPPLRHSSTLLIEPHPWALVLPGMLHIVREVGELVWQNRTKSYNITFWQKSDLLNIQESINQARHLESQLISYELPLEDEIVDPRDDTTPVKHLVSICQAYRLVALLQLYRVFPDVLTSRLKSQQTWEILAPFSVSLQPDSALNCERDIRLCQIAMSALDLIKSIPLESHTRCIQPFLLIALSSEVGSVNMDPSEGLTLSTIEARRFIRGRLESFQYVLPPKPAKCRLDLVLQIWKSLDSGMRNVYWLDIVIDKGWHFLFG